MFSFEEDATVIKVTTALVGFPDGLVGAMAGGGFFGSPLVCWLAWLEVPFSALASVHSALG